VDVAEGQRMTERDRIIYRIRTLASYFTGTRMESHVKPEYRGSRRLLGVTFVDDHGVDVDVSDELLEIADALAQLDGPKVRP
jgi:hypothetical protein